MAICEGVSEVADTCDNTGDCTGGFAEDGRRDELESVGAVDGGRGCASPEGNLCCEGDV